MAASAQNQQEDHEIPFTNIIPRMEQFWCYAGNT